MPPQPAERRVKSELLALVRTVPGGRVVTFDLLAGTLGISPTVVVTLLAGLSDDEREAAPWHRAVAKGGAIGRGPYRDAQFARLVREGVPVSPAGIVQDMPRTAVFDFAAARAGGAVPAPGQVPAAPLSRSRGMKDRPG